jgi:hypothetical protein
MNNMFKKTLLAMALASTTMAAQAGTVFTSVADVIAVATPLTVAPNVVGSALGVNNAIGGGDDSCLQAAANIGVTLNLNGKTDGAPGAVGKTAGNDTITAAALTPNVFNVASVVFTGTDACTVTLGDATSTTAGINPIEAPAGSVALTATIVPGVGGYAKEDTITITLTGATIDTARTIAPALTERDGAGALGILDITANAVRFTVPNVIAKTDILDLTGIVLASTGASATTAVAIDVFSTNTSGTKYDVVNATTVSGFAPQYSSAVDFAFNSVVDVSANRQSILASAGTGVTTDLVNTDTLDIGVKLDATTNLVANTAISFGITTSDSFAWLAAAADFAGNKNSTTTDAEVQAYLGNYLSTDNAGTFAAGDSAKISADLKTLTITDSTGGTVDADGYTIRLTVPGVAATSPLLAAQTYTVSTTVTNGVAAPNTILMTPLVNAAAGAWTLNGSVVGIPYLPFGPNAQPILRLTNTGTQTSDISARYMLEGVHTSFQDLGVVVTAAAPGLTNLLEPVMTALQAAAGVTSGKVALQITTNVPANDVTVFAATKVTTSDSDRLTIGAF